MSRKQEDKQKKSIFRPAVAVVIVIAVILCGSATGGIFFSRYLNHQIYKERVSQLTESTELLYKDLENTLDSQWLYVSAVISGMRYRHPENISQMRSYMQTVSRQLDLDNLGSHVILLDEDGVFYDKNGKQGIWSGASEIDNEKDCQSFLVDSMGSDENQMAFAWKLKQGIQIDVGTKNSSITHVILLKKMSTLTPYFRSDAYANNSLTYILRDNGVKMYSDGQENTGLFQGRNAFRTLEKMQYRDYQDFRECREDLEKNGFACANVFYENREYYLCLKKIADYDWTMLFLVPAYSVAANTMAMVNSILRSFFLLAGVALLTLCAIFFIWYRNRRTRALYEFEVKSNERLSEINQQLETAKKAAEEAFHIAEEANRSKSQFLSNMSHDMRTPMNAIVGFTTLMEKAAGDPEKVKEYTRKIGFSSQHLLGLINDVLDMSKIEAGRMKLAPEEEDIEEIIRNIEILVRPQAMAKEQKFDVLMGDITYKTVMVDKLRLNQVILNLLSNAVKYTPQGGHICLTVEELPQRNQGYANYRICVEDNGYGISEEYLQNVFQVFTREEDVRINKIQGSGLGLAITKNLVNLMGGTISVKSKKGEGSAFTLELEFCISEKLVWNQPGDLTPGEMSSNHIFEGMHVLIAEDNEINAEIISELLKIEGAVYETCENGQEAVKIFESSEEGEIHLILMDIQMPVMNGYEAARAIRQSGHPGAEKIPIIAMTANAFVEDIHDALEAGMNAHVAKPVDMQILKETVRRVLSD